MRRDTTSRDSAIDARPAASCGDSRHHQPSSNNADWLSQLNPGGNAVVTLSLHQMHICGHVGIAGQACPGRTHACACFHRFPSVKLSQTLVIAPTSSASCHLPPLRLGSVASPPSALAPPPLPALPPNDRLYTMPGVEEFGFPGGGVHGTAPFGLASYLRSSHGIRCVEIERARQQAQKVQQ